MKKHESLFMSFYHAFIGIKQNLLTERNILIHFAIMLFIIILGFLLSISYMEWLICILLFGLVISLELVNTAIETTIDICEPNYNEKAKFAKDTIAGAVLVGALVSIIIGIIIFLPKLLLLFK